MPFHYVLIYKAIKLIVSNVVFVEVNTSLNCLNYTDILSPVNYVVTIRQSCALFSYFASSRRMAENHIKQITNTCIRALLQVMGILLLLNTLHCTHMCVYLSEESVNNWSCFCFNSFNRYFLSCNRSCILPWWTSNQFILIDWFCFSFFLDGRWRLYSRWCFYSRWRLYCSYWLSGLRFTLRNWFCFLYFSFSWSSTKSAQKNLSKPPILW